VKIILYLEPHGEFYY